MKNPDSPVWFVTGSGTGFGRQIVERALAEGCHVVTTALKQSEVADLQEQYPDRALALELNVNDPKRCAEAIEEATQHFGRIDVLVNAAGYPYFTALEEGVDEDARRLFETQFWGPVNLIKAVLPQMRERRSGNIVNFSSIGGFTGFAANTYYCAAKHAVEGMSKALDIEVKPLGVRVTIIEPGSFQTGFMQVMRHNSPIEISDYADTAGFYRRVPGDVKLPGDPVRGAKAIYDAVTSGDPPLHLPLGKEGYELSVQQYRYLLDNAEKLKDVSIGADFPEGQHPLDLQQA